MILTSLQNYTSTTPRECGMEDIVRRIREDETLRCLTEGYRSTGNHRLKESAECFVPACRFEGGKQLKHVKCLTGLSLADFDHIDAARIDELRRRVNSDSHTLLSYVTISGHGLRVVFRYGLDSSVPLDKQMMFYRKAFTACNAYYSRLLDIESDGQCKNITRLSGMAHDPKVFYRPDAEVFSSEWIVSQSEAAVNRLRELKRMQREKVRLNRLFESSIAPELEAEGAVYAPGSHNDYVMRVGYRLNQWAVPLESAITWAVERFPDYEGTEQVIRSCYQRTEEHGKRRFHPKRERHPVGRDSPAYASVEEIKEFLDSRIKLRFNVITSRIEFSLMDNGELIMDNEPSDTCHSAANYQLSTINCQLYLNLSDRVVNSLWTEMSQGGMRVNIQDIYRVIESDYVPEYHPFREYLDSLPLWREGECDYIAELARSVTVKGGEQAQRRFADYLRKWLVAMVASWISEDTVNNVILVLIGPQGAYKTTWFNMLLPPTLRQYFYTKTNTQRMGKDDLLALAQYALICCEELDTMRPSELNQLKAAVTMPSVDERAAYARYAEHRTHIASFCGTGNNVQFLSDPTGNRRWLPFEIESIHSPHEHPFNHTGIYSQAYALLKGGFRFWFSQEEIRELNSHNRRFETPKLEHELVMLYFRHPGEGENGQFMTTARILQYIGENITQKLSAVNIGRALSELGYERKTFRHVRGFIVMPRNADEIKAFQKTMAMQAESDSL